MNKTKIRLAMRAAITLGVAGMLFALFVWRPNWGRIITVVHGGFIFMFGVVVIMVHRHRGDAQSVSFSHHIIPVFVGTCGLVGVACHVVLGRLNQPLTFWTPFVFGSFALLDYGLLAVLKYGIRRQASRDVDGASSGVCP